MNSKSSNAIKNNKNLENKIMRDKIYTPSNVAKDCFNKIKYHLTLDDILYEPFYGKGAFYNEFIDYERHYTEIDMGLDFFEIDDDIEMTYIITNPPYSIFSEVLDKLFLLKNLKGFGFLVNNLTMTPPRLKKIEDAGYYPSDLYIFKINSWFGYQNFWFFKKEKCLTKITYKRIQYKEKPSQ